MSAQPAKDVIYIDIDDEITGIIDKVRVSQGRIVALVLPKRATMLQSIVNIKLLKRTADESKKNLVLITGEAGLLPLAANVGLHVAKSLQSKPEVPTVAERGLAEADEAVDMSNEPDEPRLDPSKPVGELAGKAKAPAGMSAMAGGVKAGQGDDTETIALEDEEDMPELEGMDAAPATKAGKKNKKLNIPDFDKFRIWLLLGGLGIVLLIVGLYWAVVIAPKSTITIKTDNTTLQANMQITLNSTADAKLDADKALLPAQLQQTQKTLTQDVDATGQKDKGTKATGTIKFVNCSTGDALTDTSRTIPAGTGVSANGLTFITSELVTVLPSHFKADGTCKQDKPSDSVGMTAQSGGEKYNIGAATYTVAGFPSVAGSGSATSGGTSDIVKIVTQGDIDGAKQKIAAQDTAAVKQELQTALSSRNLFAVPDTLTTSNPQVSASASAGDEASKVTVTQKTTYTMLGVKQDDIKQIIGANVKKRIDPTKQSIIDYGLDKIVLHVQNQQDNSALIALEATAVAGPDLNADSLKKQVAGKKAGAAQELIKANPGVTDVSVHYSPFWVSSIPKKATKITITIQKSQTDAKSSH